MSSKNNTSLYPVLPLRDIVVFPSVIVPLFVGRKKSVNALEAVILKSSELSETQKILLVTQKDPAQDDPDESTIYKTGVLANVLQVLRLPDGTVKVIVEGIDRAAIKKYVENDDFAEAEIAVIPSYSGNITKEMTALLRTTVAAFDTYAKLNRKILPDIMKNIKEIENPDKAVDMIISQIFLKMIEKQELLETLDVSERMEKTISVIDREIGLLSAEKKIRSRVRSQMEKSQKEYYLTEQIKAIQKELGEEEAKDELSEMERKIEKVKLSKEAKDKASSEIKKLRMMNQMSSEATVVRNYLDWILEIPWKKYTRLRRDIVRAEKILNEDHYGLEKVKERIVEHLAVQERTSTMKIGAMKGQILCLVGPPGVGKTSLARSIARATGRKFVRLSLGGVRDEAEIRGHRRTYIGSMPGKIIQSMKKAGASNPLFLLDEIDKMGQDFRGDPASALLEVLDPEQNKEFNDHYMEVDYDLSDVMFITTANTMTMPRPLLDRMEIIRISGYTEEEKVKIARQHLIPRQLKLHGLKKSEWSIADSALKDVISFYTRESGVRNLEREIAKLARKAVTDITKGNLKKVNFTTKNLKQYSGVRRFDHNIVDVDDHIGVTTGLAYTEVGGDLLPIEAVIIHGGKGRITLTGKLGDVMQESAQAAWSYIRSRSYDFGIRKDRYNTNDIHIHVPEGATPKDGPSAGAAMCTTIVSALTGIAVKKTIAMTGEISLRGMVMPIGGLKEKLLAALRGGIETVLIPEKNIKDLEEIPDIVKEGLKIIPVSTVDEVLTHALISHLEPIEWKEIEKDLAVSIIHDVTKEVVTH